MVLAPVAGDAVQQDEPGIDLELVQIKSPYPRITGNHYGDYACSAVSFCKVVPQEPQMPAAAGTMLAEVTWSAAAAGGEP